MGYHWELTKFGERKFGGSGLKGHLERFENECHTDCKFVVEGMGGGTFYKKGDFIYYNENHTETPVDQIVATQTKVRTLNDLDNFIDVLEQSYICGENIELISKNGFRITIDLSAIPEIRKICVNKSLSDCIYKVTNQNK